MERIGVMELLNFLHLRNFSILKDMMSQGKSGAFFLMSPDKTLILKTLSGNE